MKRDLVFESGTSSKFWSVKVTRSAMTVVFGRTGSSGQTKTKSFDSPKDAKAAAEKLAAQKIKKGYADAGKSAPKKSAKKAPAKKAAATQTWELPGTQPRFKGHLIAFSGRFTFLRKAALVKVLAKEGAKVEDKLSAKTTLFVFAAAGSANHKRALKLKAGGQTLEVVGEDTFRRKFILPTPQQALEMLASPKDAKRLAALLEQNREEYSRGTDEFSEVRVLKAKLKGVDLSGANLHGVLLEDSDLRQTTLKNARASGWKSCDLREANAPGSQFAELQHCDFRKATLTKARFDELRHSFFESADLSKARWSEGVAECRFDGATLDGGRMFYSNVESCSFAKASLKSLDCENSEFSDCNFRNANLQKARFWGDEVTFEDCDFRQADFRGALLMAVRFVRCNIDGAQFGGARYGDIEFVDTDISKAKNLDWAPSPSGPAIIALSAAAPTFKNVTIEVTLKDGRKKMECILYQFDHGTNTSRMQAWLKGKDVGRVPLWEAMGRVAKLHPNATLDEATLKVKQTKGKTAPSHKPAAFKKLVLEAWQEALA